MKTLRLFIAVSLLFSAVSAAACGPWYYSAADNRIYYIEFPLWTPPTTDDDFESQNIKLWSRQTKCKDTAAIRQAVYGGTLGEWEAVYLVLNGHKADMGALGKNKFVRHLCKHKDIKAVKVLYGSKKYEYIRNVQRSPWYYDSHLDNDEKAELRSIYKLIDRDYLNDPLYGDRFKLLAIKCSWALGNDAVTLLMWEKLGKTMKNELLHDATEDYVARTFERAGVQRLADSIYLSHCNTVELVPDGSSTPTALNIILQIDPNSPELSSYLQRYLTRIDKEQAAVTYGCSAPTELKEDSVLIIARQAIANPKVKNKAMWRYAAACILDYKGQPKEALAMLKGTPNGGGDAFLRRSTRALTLYLRAKTEKIDQKFVDYSVGEARWLAKEMKKEWNMLSDSLKNEISHIRCWQWICGYDELYSYNVMRRIFLTDSIGLAWRMAEAGYGVRALQLANLADNYIIKLSDNHVIDSCRRFGQWEEASWGYYYKAYESENYHDYCNGLFALADRMGAKTIEDYLHRLKHPKGTTDRWFNSRGYTSKDYWEDIVGTHYLREQNYAKAAQHLKEVSPEYQRLMNIRFCRDAFALDYNTPSYDSTHYKLHFAQTMDSLRQVILHDKDKDRKGMAMIEYSIGLANSFDLCWYLTSYQKGWVGANLIDISESKYGKQAFGKAKKLRAEALKLMQTDETKAQAYARLAMLSKVMHDYPFTATAQHYALVCDHWKDYRVTIHPSYRRTLHPSHFLLLDLSQQW